MARLPYRGQLWIKAIIYATYLTETQRPACLNKGVNFAKSISMKCTVLIVDDEIDIVEVVSELLELQGFNTLKAHSVREARALLENEKIDLVISDVMMPEAPGTELRRFMHNNQRFQSIPIVFMTAFAPVSLGLSGHILGKPFDCDELLNLINNVLMAANRTPSIIQSHARKGVHLH